MAPRLSTISVGKFISMSEAAKLTPYSAEYLSLLARKGRLEAVKVSRDWLTTEEAVKAYLKKQMARHKRMLEALSVA